MTLTMTWFRLSIKVKLRASRPSIEQLPSSPRPRIKSITIPRRALPVMPWTWVFYCISLILYGLFLQLCIFSPLNHTIISITESLFNFSYDGFSLLVEIGSCLGLWTGLYIVALYQLGIDAGKWVTDNYQNTGCFRWLSIKTRLCYL